MDKNKSAFHKPSNAAKVAGKALLAFFGSILAILVGIITFPILGEAVFAGYQLTKYFHGKEK